MRNFVKQVLTRKIKLTRCTVEVEPSPRLVYAMYFAIATLICLTILEATYILVLRSFSSEIFSVITGLIGTIVGVFLTSKG